MLAARGEDAQLIEARLACKHPESDDRTRPAGVPRDRELNRAATALVFAFLDPCNEEELEEEEIGHRADIVPASARS